MSHAPIYDNSHSGSASTDAPFASQRLIGWAHGVKMAYTLNLNFMSSYGRQRGGVRQVPGHAAYPNNCIFVFDPGFEDFARRQAQPLAAYRDDPNLFGYFSDNEMPFRKDNLDGYLKLDPEEPGGRFARAWIQERGLTSETFTEAHRLDFLALVATRYFSIVRQAIREVDPNHLYLGPRFYSQERHIQSFMKIAGQYLDVVSCNYYGHWTPNPQHLRQWSEWTGRPFLVTEFYTKGDDSGLPNQSGAGWIVRTQRDRGLFYQNFCLGLLESPHCIGWHYFKYQDNDPTLKGAEPSNIDANKGIVNHAFEPYLPMLEEMKKVNDNIYTLADWLADH